MQSTMIESANLFRLVHFFDVLAAVVFAVSGALVASRKGIDVMVHHPQYIFDDAILPIRAAYWVTLAEQYLQ
jgi:uncharacterized membrane protein YeiH